jgi:hypothetical protein
VSLGISSAGTIIVAAHATLLVFDPRADLLSNLFILSMRLLGVTVCLLGACTKSPETKPLWLLLGSGFLLTAVGQIGSTNCYLARRTYTFRPRPSTPTSSSLRTQFLSCWASAPPVRMPTEIIAWLDGAQALIAAMLAYLQLFSALPGYRQHLCSMNYLDIEG